MKNVDFFLITFTLAGLPLFNFLSKHFFQLQFKNNFFIQFYGSTKSCARGSYVSPQHFVFGVFAVRIQLRLCRNRHFCNVLKVISSCLLLMIWPLLLSQLLLKTTKFSADACYLTSSLWGVTLDIRTSFSGPLFIDCCIGFFKIIFIGTSKSSPSSIRDGWLVRQYELFFTLVVVYGVVSTICCSIPASSHIPSNCQDYFCCESRPFFRVTGSELYSIPICAHHYIHQTVAGFVLSLNVMTQTFYLDRVLQTHTPYLEYLKFYGSYQNIRAKKKRKKEIWLWQLCFPSLLKLHFNPCEVTPMYFSVSLLYSFIPLWLTKYMYCTVCLLFHIYCIKMETGHV